MKQDSFPLDSFWKKTLLLFFFIQSIKIFDDLYLCVYKFLLQSIKKTEFEHQ